MRVGIAELLPSTVTRNVMTEAELLGFGFLGRFRSLGLFGALHLGLQLGQRRDVAEGRLFDRSVDLLHRVLGCVVCLAALGAFGLSLLTPRVVERTGVRNEDALGGFRELDHLEVERFARLGRRAVLLDQLLGRSETFDIGRPAR